MTAAPAEATQEPAGGAPAPEPAPQGTPAPAEAPKPAEPKAPEWDGKVESLPADAQKMIRELRGKDAEERVAAKTLAAIQKALNPEATDEKPDPVKLANQLAERENEARSAKVELAIYKAAAAAGADPDALLDSNSFRSTLTEVDPSDAAAIKTAIDKAVKANPKFKLVQAARASGSDFSGGSSEGAISQAQFDSMNVTERTNLYNTNPALYRQLSGR